MPAKMWFGSRGYERWVPAPAVDMEVVHAHAGSRQDQLRGGVSIRASRGGHEEYGMSWEAISHADLDDIQDTLDGLYDTDNARELISFISPDVIGRNALPRLWAAPYLCAYGPSLSKGVKPTLSNTNGNSFALPPKTATFANASNPLELYIPIPPGHTAWFAFYGPAAQGTGIGFRTTVGLNVSGINNVGVRANSSYGTGLTQVVATEATSGMLLAINAGATITAGLLIIRETSKGAPPAPTRYLSGRGHSGCKVEPGSFSSLVNSTYHDVVAASVRLVETGSWL